MDTISYLSTHVGTLPLWSILGIFFSGLILIMMFPIDAWQHRQQKDFPISRKRVIATITVFSVGLIGVLSFLSLGVMHIKSESSVALSNLSYNLHQKYNFDSMVSVDNITPDDVENGGLLWMDGAHKVTITVNQEKMTFTLVQDEKTYEPTMYGVSGMTTVDNLLKSPKEQVAKGIFIPENSKETVLDPGNTEKFKE